MDCYNANPSSMRAAIGDFATERPTNGRSRRVMILGDMLELGAWSAEEHAAILRLAMQDPAAEIYLVGSEFGKAGKTLESSTEPNIHANLRLTKYYSSREELETDLKAHPLTGATVLLKGSHGIGLEKLIGLF